MTRTPIKHMVRHEEDKEDLIADATALVDRAEFWLAEGVPSASVLITAGFRRGGQLSLYFDQDPFYQFDTDGRLRRALEDSFLYRSQGETLARLHRERQEGRTALVRSDLSRDELLSFRNRLLTRVSGFAQSLADDLVERRRRVVQDEDFELRLQRCVTRICEVGENFLSHSINQR